MARRLPRKHYERLLHFVEYLPHKGEFRCTNTGKPLGHFSGGYVHLYVPSTDGVKVKGHRYAWFFVHGTLPDLIDHDDNNPANNKLSNLRVATTSQNAMNAKVPSDNTSGTRGVSWCPKRNRWRAYITIGGKQRYLGRFAELEDAIKARKEAEAELFGEFTPDYTGN